MDNIYLLSDDAICSRVGEHLKTLRLRQNLAQETLSKEAGISVSSIKKIEKGQIASFDSLLRVIRTLGELDALAPLIEEVKISPNEYYKMVNSRANLRRKRAAKRLTSEQAKEESEW